MNKIFRELIQLDTILPIIGFIVLLMNSATEHPSTLMMIVGAGFLGASVMAAVHNAETIAHKIGDSLGTIVLAVSVTIIEVGLIVSIMGQGTPGSESIARDTVFAAVMIITNGIVGLCLILGGIKYKEQEFHVQGSNSLLVVLIVLSLLVFVLPNQTTTTAGPTFSEKQLIFVGIVCVLLYVICVLFQTKTHKGYFAAKPMQGDAHEVSSVEAWVSFFALCVSLMAVIGLAKQLSPTLEKGVEFIGAPKSVVGLIIATIVLLPESWAAMNAARANRLQTSLNLALGSGIASIALTIPVVIAYAIMNKQTLTLGLDSKHLTFMLMSFLTAMITLGTGKSTLLQGSVHAVILLTYFVMSFIP